MSADANELDRFLASVEKQAFAMAKLAVKNEDDALDIVQDSMLTLARKYAARPPAQWRPLFFRILQNQIRDFWRRSSTRGKWLSLFSSFANSDGDALDLASLHAGRSSDQPEQRAALDATRSEMLTALGNLPLRQQQVFALRAVEGLNVAETALAMRCSEGSVKTHYSRAVHRLRELLEAHTQ